MSKLSPVIRNHVARFRTRGHLTHEAEFHNLASLAQRLLLAPTEILDVISRGDLIALHSTGNKFMFSTYSLDAMRDSVIELVAGEVIKEMLSRGSDEATVVVALSRAFAAQTQLSRTDVAEFIELARDDDDHTLRNAALLAGGGAAGYGAYRYLKGRKRTGTPQLPGSRNGPDVDIDAMPVSPRPKGPSGSDGVRVVDAMGSQHPGSPKGNVAALPAPGATSDLLGDAVARGRKAIGQRGSAIWRALRGAATATLK